MKIIKQFLKEKYNLSNYQIAQLIFLGKTVLSESSKILIMSFIFYKQLPLYFFSLLIMCILRYSTGGIHFYTYIILFFLSFLGGQPVKSNYYRLTNHENPHYQLKVKNLFIPFSNALQ